MCIGASRRNSDRTGSRRCPRKKPWTEPSGSTYGAIRSRRMEPHDLEIEIGKDGRVRVKTSGAKGKSCLEYIRLVERIVGKAEHQELTAEYYEPDTGVKIDAPQQEKQHERRRG